MTKRSDSAKPESLGEFEQCLLVAVVHLGQEAYGVTIRQEIERRTDREVAIGALYTSLHRMETRGWLTAEWAISPKGRRAKYYRLAPEGRRQLRAGEREWARFSGAVARIFARGAS